MQSRVRYLVSFRRCLLLLRISSLSVCDRKLPIGPSLLSDGDDHCELSFKACVNELSLKSTCFKEKRPIDVGVVLCLETSYSLHKHTCSRESNFKRLVMKPCIFLPQAAMPCRNICFRFLPVAVIWSEKQCVIIFCSNICLALVRFVSSPTTFSLIWTSVFTFLSWFSIFF